MKMDKLLIGFFCLCSCVLCSCSKADNGVVKRESVIAPPSTALEESFVTPDVAARNLIARLDARFANAFDGTQKKHLRPRPNPGSDQKQCRKHLGHHLGHHHSECSQEVLQLAYDEVNTYEPGDRKEYLKASLEKIANHKGWSIK
ncbi:MAG: hypothetical protein LBP57_01180 [Endomicrobium sp.]|jgi:hypothetical protein|nr:hypothetical protein [Endomicrobium sp.]